MAWPCGRCPEGRGASWASAGPLPAREPSARGPGALPESSRLQEEDAPLPRMARARSGQAVLGRASVRPRPLPSPRGCRRAARRPHRRSPGGGATPRGSSEGSGSHVRPWERASIVGLQLRLCVGTARARAGPRDQRKGRRWLPEVSASLGRTPPVNRAQGGPRALRWSR